MDYILKQKMFILNFMARRQKHVFEFKNKQTTKLDILRYMS